LEKNYEKVKKQFWVDLGVGAFLLVPLLLAPLDVTLKWRSPYGGTLLQEGTTMVVLILVAPFLVVPVLHVPLLVNLLKFVPLVIPHL